MPVYKRTYRRKPRAVAKPTLPMKYRIADTAEKAYKTAMYVKNLINVEKKHYDYDQTITPNYTGSITTINNPDAGTTDITRIGDSILNKSIEYKGYSMRNGADALVRVLLIWDKQNTVATVADCLDKTGSGYAPLCSIKKDNFRQFRILYDNTHTVSTYRPLHQFSISLKNLDTHTQFEAATTAINSGAYKLLVISNLNANVPNVFTSRRFQYIDN